MLNKIKKIIYIVFLCIYWIICGIIIMSFIGGIIKGLNPQSGKDVDGLIYSMAAIILTTPSYFLLKFLNKKTDLPLPILVTGIILICFSLTVIFAKT